MQRTVTEYLHRAYQQPMPSSFQTVPVLDHDYNLSSYLEENSPEILASTKYPTSKHDNIKSVSAADLSSLIEERLVQWPLLHAFFHFLMRKIKAM